jgi:hypothetical protein
MALNPETFDTPDGTFELEVRGETLTFAYRLADDIQKPESMRQASAFWQLAEKNRRRQQDDDAPDPGESIDPSQVELGEKEFAPIVEFVRGQIADCTEGLEGDWSDLPDDLQRKILRSDAAGLVEAYVQIFNDDGLEVDEKKS